MTQHPSLRAGLKGSAFRSVLKRYEKIKELSEKEKWDEKKDSIYHLPKVKRVKFKIKKTKAEAEEGAAAGTEIKAETATGAAGAKPLAKPAAGAAKPAAGAQAKETKSDAKGKK